METGRNRPFVLFKGGVAQSDGPVVQRMSFTEFAGNVLELLQRMITDRIVHLLAGERRVTYPRGLLSRT